MENNNDQDVCRLCGTPDQNKRHDHLRECYKDAFHHLHHSQFCPRLFDDEMKLLWNGANNICSNRRLCRNRQSKK